PDALGAPGGDLPWGTLAGVDQEGCGYASALLNLSDSLNEVGASITQLNNLNAQVQGLSGAFDSACQTGCTACGLTCTSCPKTLRHRSSCDRDLPTANDLEACAAAGLVAFMNTVGWQ
ncbi:MAG: hypothetical protein KGQ59_04965, partial [Bdellovibrionales bacterium]|nr:hypothetical protein [Bdellovibrionales bacterium]